MARHIGVALAAVSVGCGLLAGLWLWIYPITGIIVSVGGILCAGLAWKSAWPDVARVGAVFSVLSLCLSAFNLLLELYLF